jgi:SAM-dependent methyltransferase
MILFAIFKNTFRFFRNEIRRIQFYKKQKNNFLYLEKQNINYLFKMDWRNRKIILNEATTNTEFDRHYIYHPAWAVRIIKKLNPEIHYDISSVLSFSSILSAFIPVKFFDYRPAKLELSNLLVNSADLTKLSFADNSILSLSCMHTIEHIGLGRYGDELDFNGDIKAMKELARVLKVGGCLLIVTPIGNLNQIQFNAHRIYTKDYIIEMFIKFGLKLVEFVLIPEQSKDGGLVSNPTNKLLEQQNYACGCFWFTK